MINHVLRGRRALLAGFAAVVAAVGLSTGIAHATDVAHATTPQASPHTWHVLVGAQGAHRAVQTMGFYPTHLWVDQGDTVTWVANSAEIHTVTFLATAPCDTGELCAPPQGFDPGDPLQSTPQGGTSYDGSSYYNSGVLTSATGDTGPLPPFVHVQRTYSLTFPDTLAPGTYNYLCLVHGMTMTGTVVVQSAGTPYPFRQWQYDRYDHHRIRADIRDGLALWRKARHDARRQSSWHHRVVLSGVMDDRAMVMRFIPAWPEIRVGDQVTFVATSMGEPHTVTFGSDETGCGTPPCNPEAPWNVALDANGNETADYPGQNGGWTGDTQALNSGLMLGLPPAATGVPSQLTVRFTQPGSFRYVCALHDYMGMVGRVQVHRDR